jgi:hypothetical protein
LILCCRYKHVSEQFWNKVHSSGEKAFKFDIDLCRRVFNTFDRDRSGFLEVGELAKLAEELWAKFHPEDPKLSSQKRKV